MFYGIVFVFLEIIRSLIVLFYNFEMCFWKYLKFRCINKWNIDDFKNLLKIYFYFLIVYKLSR